MEPCVIASGVRFIDIIFLSRFGMLYMGIQLIPYMFHGALRKQLYIYWNFLFAVGASVMSGTIFISYEKYMPYYTSNCDSYLYDNAGMELVMVYLVQRMFVDTLHILWHGPHDKPITKLYLFHHILIFVGGCIGIHMRCMVYFFTSYAFAEVSTIFLNFKEVYQQVWGINSRTLNNINTALFAVSFLIFRIVYLPFKHITDIINYIECGDATYPLPLYLNFGSIPITLLSYYWFISQIVPIVLCKLSRTKKPSLTN